MITQFMNDDEKCFEAFRMYPTVYDWYLSTLDFVKDKFQRATKFPYTISFKYVDDRKNNWTLLFTMPTKESKKKMRYGCFAYITYEIEKLRKDGTKITDSNTGKGVIGYQPDLFYDTCVNKTRATCILDFVPHCLNQYRERYLKPIGQQDIPLHKQVASIMRRWMHFDVMGDKQSERHVGDYIGPYNVFMRNGGQLCGDLVNNVLIRFTTYITGDMMFEDQRTIQSEMQKEYFDWKKKGFYK